MCWEVACYSACNWLTIGNYVKYCHFPRRDNSGKFMSLYSRAETASRVPCTTPIITAAAAAIDHTFLGVVFLPLDVCWGSGRGSPDCYQFVASTPPDLQLPVAASTPTSSSWTGSDGRLIGASFEVPSIAYGWSDTQCLHAGWPEDTRARCFISVFGRQRRTFDRRLAICQQSIITLLIHSTGISV